MDMRCVLYDFMEELKLSPRYVGYLYIESIVIMLYEDSSQLSSLSKHIYPTVASKFNTNDKNLQKAVEVTLNHAFAMGGLKMFGSKACPPNKSVICYLVNRLRQYSYKNRIVTHI